MPRPSIFASGMIVLIGLTPTGGGLRAAEPSARWIEAGVLAAPEANQAAAADEQFVYAIDNAVIAKYERATGKRIGKSTGAAQHLNSGFLWKGKLYCAHSNYPQTPARSEIKVLDTETLQLATFKDFADAHGSLTWVVREDAAWWCNFAHYGDENARTVLVKFDDAWREQGAWTYPPEVTRDLGRYSISGGLWQDARLLVTGHDKPVIYRLRLPQDGGVLQWVDTQSAPFPGQGIALDPRGGLLGIQRALRRVVFARLAESE
jgi:hypothetical protein